MARVRARRALESEGIARGGSDIVWDDGPMTPAERKALGLDRGFFDDEAVADTASEHGTATTRS